MLKIIENSIKNRSENKFRRIRICWASFIGNITRVSYLEIDWTGSCKLAILAASALGNKAFAFNLYNFARLLADTVKASLPTYLFLMWHTNRRNLPSLPLYFLFLLAAALNQEHDKNDGKMSNYYIYNNTINNTESSSVNNNIIRK